MKLNDSIKSLTFSLWILVKIILLGTSIYKLPSMILTIYHSNFDLTALTVTIWLFYCALTCIGIFRSKVLFVSGLLVQFSLAIAVFVLYKIYAFSDFGLYSGLLMLVFGWWIHFVGNLEYEKIFKEFTILSITKFDLSYSIDNFKENLHIFLREHQYFEMVVFFFWHISRGLILLLHIPLVYIGFWLIFLSGFNQLFVISFFWFVFCFFSSFGINRWKFKTAISVLFQLFFFYKLIVWLATENQPIALKTILLLLLYFGCWWIFVFGQFCYVEYWKDD